MTIKSVIIMSDNVLNRYNGEKLGAGTFNSERMLRFLGNLSADRRLLVNASRKNAIVLQQKATTLTGGSSKQNYPMTDHSRYNCYEGESREGD